MIDDIVRRKGYLTLGSRLKRIGERLQAEVQQLIDQHGIPIQSFQYPLLASLDENGPLEIGELARSLGVSQPGVTRSIGQLAKGKLVTVRRSKNDQRVKVVALTKKGRAVVEDGRSNVWPHIERCLEDILSGQSGNLLDQLAHIEDALADSPIAKRIATMDRAGGDG